jgi:hypothetical protein
MSTAARATLFKTLRIPRLLESVFHPTAARCDRRAPGATHMPRVVDADHGWSEQQRQGRESEPQLPDDTEDSAVEARFSGPWMKRGVSGGLHPQPVVIKAEERGRSETWNRMFQGRV